MKMAKHEKDELRKLIGKRVTSARMMRGISQSELAKALSVSRCTISNLENGKSMVSADTLLQIVEILDVGFDELLPEYISERGRMGQKAETSIYRSGGLEAEDMAPKAENVPKLDMEQGRFLSELEVLMDRMIAKRMAQMNSKDM